MSVTLLEVWRAARARTVPFSGESAGFAALSLCEATQHSPRSLALNDAELGEDGTVRLLSNRACSPQQADKELRTLLGRLIEVSSSPGPSLFRVAGRGGGHSLSLLAEEIEKALIPLNRSAARRALVRLHRETARAVEQGKLAPLPDLEEPAQIRLSPPPPPAAPSDSPPVAVLRSTEPSRPTPPPVALKVDAQVPRDPSPLAPAASPIPVIVACETPPPAPQELAKRDVEAMAPIALASREPTLPLSLPLVQPPTDALELTRAETVVARRARGMPVPVVATVAPRERPEKTPRMGSVDVAVIEIPPSALSALPDGVAEATERVPPVNEDVAADSLQALAAWPLSSSSVYGEHEPEKASTSARRLPRVEPLENDAGGADANPARADEGQEALPLPSFELDTEPTPDLPTVEPPAVRGPSACVGGGQSADSDERAESLAEDQLETRPLLSSLEALAVEPIRHILAPQSDVRELLSDFKVQGGLSENELRRELKALAGVDLTPGTGLNVGPR